MQSKEPPPFCIVESFLPTATTVKLSLTGSATKLKNLVTGEILTGQLPPAPRGWRGQSDPTEARVAFQVTLPPHS